MGEEILAVGTRVDKVPKDVSQNLVFTVKFDYGHFPLLNLDNLVRYAKASYCLKTTKPKQFSPQQLDESAFRDHITSTGWSHRMESLAANEYVESLQRWNESRVLPPPDSKVTMSDYLKTSAKVTLFPANHPTDSFNRPQVRPRFAHTLQEIVDQAEANGFSLESYYDVKGVYPPIKSKGFATNLPDDDMVKLKGFYSKLAQRVGTDTSGFPGGATILNLTKHPADLAELKSNLVLIEKTLEQNTQSRVLFKDKDGRYVEFDSEAALSALYQHWKKLKDMADFYIEFKLQESSPEAEELEQSVGQLHTKILALLTTSNELKPDKRDLDDDDQLEIPF